MSSNNSVSNNNTFIFAPALPSTSFAVNNNTASTSAPPSTSSATNNNTASTLAPSSASSAANNNTSAPSNRRRRRRNNIGNNSPVEWTERQIRLLIDQRKYRNEEYYRIVGRSRRGFWDSVARRINRSKGTNFYGNQCKRKFQNLVSAYYVSIMYNNKYMKLNLVSKVKFGIEYVHVFSWG